MRIHVICTGSELLEGHTLNTNLVFLGEQLGAAGYGLGREVCVPDGREAIAGALRDELRLADVVITIGGLGPTSDDLTRDVVAAELGLPLEFSPAAMQVIEAFLQHRNVRVPSAALRVQAMVPRTAEVLPNRSGTAPGLWCEAGGRAVVLLPGPPREFQPMFLESVLPRLQRRAAPEVVRRAIRVCGLGESVIAERVEEIVVAYPGVAPAYCAKPAVVDVRLSAPPSLTVQLDEAWREVRAWLGDAALPDGCPSLVEAVVGQLRSRGWRLATAESCTGGLIAATITEVAGVSDVFVGSAVVYHNDWKVGLLGVRPETLQRSGAVSAECAREMVTGLQTRYGAEAGIAVTGIAGPGGGTAEKPVGLVFVATATPAGVDVQRFVYPGSRESVRQRTTTVALNLLRLQLIRGEREVRLPKL